MAAVGAAAVSVSLEKEREQANHKNEARRDECAKWPLSVLRLCL